MKSVVFICCVLSGLFLTLIGCQSEEKMCTRNGQCCYDRKEVYQGFSVKGPQWQPTMVKTEEVCTPCSADAGSVCESCK